MFGEAPKADSEPVIDVKTLHAKIGELTLENDFSAVSQIIGGDGSKVLLLPVLRLMATLWASTKQAALIAVCRH